MYSVLNPLGVKMFEYRECYDEPIFKTDIDHLGNVKIEKVKERFLRKTKYKERDVVYIKVKDEMDEFWHVTFFVK